jgi:hypothetical protein
MMLSSVTFEIHYAVNNEGIQKHCELLHCLAEEDVHSFVTVKVFEKWYHNLC